MIPVFKVNFKGEGQAKAVIGFLDN